MDNKKKSQGPDKWDVCFGIFFPLLIIIGFIVTAFVWFAEMNK
ncbi:hypothetical protein ABEY52_22125 [Priestia aryabhattai]